MVQAHRKAEELPTHICFSATDTLVTTKLSTALLCLVKDAHRPESKSIRTRRLSWQLRQSCSCIRAFHPKTRPWKMTLEYKQRDHSLLATLLICFKYTLSCNPNICFFSFISYFSIRKGFMIRNNVIRYKWKKYYKIISKCFLKSAHWPPLDYSTYLTLEQWT